MVGLAAGQQGAVAGDVALGGAVGRGQIGQPLQGSAGQVHLQAAELGAAETVIGRGPRTAPKGSGLMQADGQGHAHRRGGRCRRTAHPGRCTHGQQRHAVVVAQHGGIGATAANHLARHFQRFGRVGHVDHAHLHALVPRKPAIARAAVRQRVLADAQQVTLGQRKQVVGVPADFQLPGHTGVGGVAQVQHIQRIGQAVGDQIGPVTHKARGIQLLTGFAQRGRAAGVGQRAHHGQGLRGIGLEQRQMHRAVRDTGGRR